MLASIASEALLFVVRFLPFCLLVSFTPKEGPGGVLLLIFIHDIQHLIQKGGPEIKLQGQEGTREVRERLL